MFEIVYDALLAAIKEHLSDHKEIIHPYDLEIFNKQDNLSIGFGVAVGSAEFERLNNFTASVRRSFTIKLTKKFYTANYTPEFRQNKEKELIDTGFGLYNFLQQKFKKCSVINSVELESDTGIEFFEDNKYITYAVNIIIAHKGE